MGELGDGRPRLLDLYCGAGGAAMGYYRAGFDVVGVDIKPQKNYPFPFILGDALDILGRMLAGEKFLASDGRWYGIEDFDAFHASPPCQRYSTMTKRWGREAEHPALIEPTRTLLKKSGKPYSIENVPGAPLFQPILLCGSMFPGLRVRRHRWFELSFFILTMACEHETQGEIVGVYGHAGGRSRRDDKTFHNTDDWRLAMDIDWMSGKELAESIPPAYTEFIGRQLMAAMVEKCRQ